VLVLFAGCKEDKEEAGNNLDTPAQPVLTVMPDSIPASKTAGSYSITVTSNCSWTAQVWDKWCTVSPASGTNNGTVTVNVAENNTVHARASGVTLYYDDDRKLEVPITQPPLPTRPCIQCCWDNATGWVDCHVTTYAYPFDNNTTNTKVVWSGYDETYYEGARSDRNGRANTAAISSRGISAVQLCKDLGPGWYLPAYEELVNMSWGIGFIGPPLNDQLGVNLLNPPEGYYWSSTEYYLNCCRYYNLDPEYKSTAVIVGDVGDVFFELKYNRQYVRCAWRE
jgi:hypothetical protein